LSLLQNSDFQLLESILWNTRFFLLEEHLRRLENSSLVLGIPLQGKTIQGYLANFEKMTLTKGKSFKVRLLVSQDGACTVEAEEIRIQKKLPWNVGVSAIPTSSRDPYLYHKTTNRSLYNAELIKYRQLGYDEVLFCNEHGEVTEGAVTNILAKIHGRWVTPDVQCGLLAGVYRGCLMKRMNGRLQAARISMRELLQAERILLCNSVRGCITVGNLDTTVPSPRLRRCVQA
jgi:para-aminobenzoate synthetase / 4-amino-4-deoxychorismate lyase